MLQADTTIEELENHIREIIKDSRKGQEGKEPFSVDWLFYENRLREMCNLIDLFFTN